MTLKENTTTVIGKVIDCSVQVIEKTFHLKIEYNGGEFFFVVETLELPDIKGVIIKSICRGVTFWDCQLKLTNSQKKKIKQTIKEYVLVNCK